MKHHDKELQMYAENGLRTAEDWASLGRAVEGGTPPRAETTVRGQAVALFGRGQTRHQPSTRAARRLESAAAAPAPVESGGQ